MALGPITGGVFSTVNDSLSTVGGGGQVVVVPSATPVPAWTFCADENFFCAFSGTAPVRYGKFSTWVIETHTDGVMCDNAEFGDPLYGTYKECQVFQ